MKIIRIVKVMLPFGVIIFLLGFMFNSSSAETKEIVIDPVKIIRDLFRKPQSQEPKPELAPPEQIQPERITTQPEPSEPPRAPGGVEVQKAIIGKWERSTDVRGKELVEFFQDGTISSYHEGSGLSQKGTYGFGDYRLLIDGIWGCSSYPFEVSFSENQLILKMDIQKAIIGKWERRDMKGKELVEFFKDGTVSSYHEGLGLSQKGTYRFTGYASIIIDGIHGWKSYPFNVFFSGNKLTLRTGGAVYGLQKTPSERAASAKQKEQTERPTEVEIRLNRRISTLNECGWTAAGALGITITKLGRDKDYTFVWIAFQKIVDKSKSYDIGGNSYFVIPENWCLTITDDRGNNYSKDFKLSLISKHEEQQYATVNLGGCPLNAGFDLPKGFTWTPELGIPVAIPQIAPISKIEVYPRNADWDKRFKLDFKNACSPDLDFKIDPRNLIVPRQELFRTKDLLVTFESMRTSEKIEKDGKYISVNILMNGKNLDYNPHHFTSDTFFLQLSSGRVVKLGSHIHKMEALSERTLENPFRLKVGEREKAKIVIVYFKDGFKGFLLFL